MSALVGPVAWTAHELLSYMLAAFGCSVSPLLHVLTLACLGVTDFVLVPVKPSPFDVDRMLDTLNVLINGVSGRRPVFRCVLTQTTRDSVIAKHIRSELAEAGFPVLDSEMTNRVVYAEAALWGATPSLLDKKGPAAREIAAIADEVQHICESMAQVKRAANA